MEEYLDILDEDGNKTGEIKTRSKVHIDGYWHKTVHIWIINNHGEVLLQRRSAIKDSDANMLDISCAGHLLAGENSLSGAIRELKEELNLDVFKEDLMFIKTIKNCSDNNAGFINNEFSDLYILKTDKTINDMKFLEDEISEIFFVPKKEFKNMIHNNQEDLLMYDEEFEILFKLF